MLKSSLPLATLARVRSLALAAAAAAAGHAVKPAGHVARPSSRPFGAAVASSAVLASRIAALPPGRERAWLKSCGRVPGREQNG